MNKTTLYLSAETTRRLRQLAKRTGRRQSELIRQALDQYLSSAPDELPPSVGSAEDPELGARDSEDWLRSNWRPRS